MRADDVRSTTFQTKTAATDAEELSKPTNREPLDSFQTSGIRLSGRKGENGRSDGITSALAEIRARWIQSADEQQLRIKLLALLLKLENI